MTRPTTDRILSLDIFRGLVMAMMIVVNNQSGRAFDALRHKPWDGCTPTDLVFPFFLFIVGVSMWFSYRKTDHRLTGAATLRLLKRGALIFLVGLALHLFPFWDFRAGEWVDLGGIRIMGVLQRIGVAFFVGGVLALWLGTYRRIFIAVGVLLVGYFGLVEGLGNATLEDFVGNRVDAFLLGVRHLYSPELPFDPEGLFSTIPSLATVLLGYALGKFVGENRGGNESDYAKNRMKTLGTMGIAGGLSVVAGLALNTVCPINKAIWSPSFVLYTAGLATLMWMALLWFYDYRGGRFGATFGAVFGTNTLFSYVLAGVLMRTIGLPFFRFDADGQSQTVYSWWSHTLAGVMSEQLATLLASVTLIAVIWLIVWPLYRKKIFIRL
jgi:predicted acyltransferase